MDLEVLVNNKQTVGQQHALVAKSSYILDCISKKGRYFFCFSEEIANAIASVGCFEDC